MKMSGLALTWAFVVLASIGPSSAKTIYVKANATGGKTGSSWANAYTDFTAALTASVSGDEIWVASGTYKPTTGTNRDISFYMNAGVPCYGGFAGSESLRSQRNPNSNPTILSGDIGYPDANWDNSRTVIYGSSHSILDGFTIKGGNHDAKAGGLCIESLTSFTVQNCTFLNNRGWSGGAVYNLVSSASLINCIFIGNSAYNGAGLHAKAGSVLISGCTFTDNGNSTDGTIYSDYFTSIKMVSSRISRSTKSGIHCVGSTVTLLNCIIDENNHSTWHGAGMEARVSTVMATNCVFSKNLATWGGGCSLSTGKTTMTNCVFAGNSASARGGAIENVGTTVLTNCTFIGNSSQIGGGLYSMGWVTLTNSLFWNNSATRGPEILRESGSILCRNCNIQGSGGSGIGWNATLLGTDGGGNIMADPLFLNPSAPEGKDGIWYTTDDGVRLRPNSACIDRGLTDSSVTKDILGKARIGKPDIGAYEYYADLKNAVAIWPIYN